MTAPQIGKPPIGKPQIGKPPIGRPHRSGQHAGLLERAIAEEHHLADIARDGYAPATLPIVLAATFLALLAVVGVALGVSVAVYYWA